MPAVQTSYSVTMRPALAGMLSDMTPRTVISRVVEESAGLGFGAVAVQGTGDRQVRASEAGRAFVGITVMDPAAAPTAAPASPDQYADKDVCAVMTKGTAWVLVGAAVAAGDPAFYVPATGVITNASSGNTAMNGIFRTSAASGALAILELR